METNKCEVCSSSELGEGVWSGYARLNPKGKFSLSGSNVIVDVCSDCGHIQNMRVKNPKIFKRK
jgi:hypothetical protein